MDAAASSHSVEVAMWIFGGLLTVLAALVGVIYRHSERRHDEHDESIKWLREHHVSKETLERVERTMANAIDDMIEERRSNHAENKDAMREIKDSVNGIHRRIDEEFRFIRNLPKA